MDADFWHRRWSSGQIGFHESQPNTFLVAHFETLAIPDGGRVFVPLCGKTLAIGWLLDQGYRVAGVELNRFAVEQLFDGLGRSPKVSNEGVFQRFSDDGIDVFVGDFFALDRALLGPVDAVFDRAALIALPEELRARYARRLIEATVAARQLLVSFAYDQRLMDGPPFSVPEDEVRRLYRDRFELRLLAEESPPGGLRQADVVREQVWLLTPRIGG